jgi:hypothetical protein
MITQAMIEVESKKVKRAKVEHLGRMGRTGG